jgi:hypothetical protein
MKTRRYVFALFLAILAVATVSALIPQAAYAQNCFDRAGNPIPCPQEKRTKRPTAVPPSRTPTPTSTPTSAPTPAGIIPPGANDPAAPNPGPGLPGGLGMLILVMIIGVLLIGGLLRFRTRPVELEIGSAKPGIDPGPINLNADPASINVNDRSMNANDGGQVSTNLNENTDEPGSMNLNE